MSHDELDAMYACSSTSMSIHELDRPICSHPKEDRPRQFALYRQHVKRKGIYDQMLH